MSEITEADGPAPQGGDDGRLVAAARRGELGAFDTLMARYQRQATSVAYRLLNNMDDAMEVTQDAFLQAFDKLSSLNKPERFGPWLMRITGNLALNRRRYRSLRKAVSLDAVDSQDDGAEMQLSDPLAVMPDEAASAEDVKKIINRAVSELPEMQQRALIMFSVDQLPQKDIADILGCSVEAVKWHVFTARKKLKDKLKDYL